MQPPSHLVIEGRLADASNGTYLCVDQTGSSRFVYKPVSGERPLWDFPESTLTGREIAASEISSLLGWNLVPKTYWTESGPLGAGMTQQWIDEREDSRPINLFHPDSIPLGWIPILSAQDSLGNPVVLAHDDTQQLRKLALFDAVINNGDRKAGHIIESNAGVVFGIDHGVSFHHENKLRTVLWGWLDTPIERELLDDLAALKSELGDHHPAVDVWLSDRESQALRNRINQLLTLKTYPVPSQDWPAVPWPVF